MSVNRIASVALGVVTLMALPIVASDELLAEQGNFLLTYCKEAACIEQHGPYEYDSGGSKLLGYVLGKLPRNNKDTVKFKACDEDNPIPVTFAQLISVKSQCTGDPGGGVWVKAQDMLVPKGIAPSQLLASGIKPSGINIEQLPESLRGWVASKQNGAVAAYSLEWGGTGMTLAISRNQ
jgi:hypothetical protein